MKDKEKNFVSAVIYVHNTQDKIEEFLKVVIEVMETYFEHSEIICVNDSSTDRSLDKIKKVSSLADIINISVINLSYFHGMETAMNAGIDLSIGDFVFEFDGTDDDFDKKEIMNIYWKAIKEGYDIVSASADREEQWRSKIFYKLFAHFSDLSYEMCTESFRILSRRAINRIVSMNKTVPYRKAVYANCGLKTANIKYSVVKATSQKSSDRKERAYRTRLAVDSLILFTEVGYRFSIIMTVLMMFMSVFMTVYSCVIYLTSHPVAGWTTTILFLSVVFFGLFGVMSVVIKYLQLLVNLIFRRSQYCFESIEKLTK